MKNLYPLFVNLENALCLVIGGGNVAERKIEGLMDAKAASIRVISPKVVNRIRKWAKDGALTWEKRDAEVCDLDALMQHRGPRLVFLCTNVPFVQRRLSDACRARGLMANVADDADESGFLCASVIRQGPIHIACSTAGESPLLAVHLRKKIEGSVDEAYAVLCSILGEVRQRDLKKRLPAARRRTRMQMVLDGGVLETIRMQGEKAGREMAKELLRAEEGI